MKPMTVTESVREWIEMNHDFDDLQVVIAGESSDLVPPFVGIMEQDVSTFEQAGVTMYGVSTYGIEVELHTVPVEESEDGTPDDLSFAMRREMADIVQDRDALVLIANRNGWTVFDFRPGNPITEASDGRRVTRWSIEIVAAPN